MIENDDGISGITVGPLEPNLFDYGFSIGDSTRTTDPANRNVIQRISGHTSYFEVPGFRWVPGSRWQLAWATSTCAAAAAGETASSKWTPVRSTGN